MRSVLLLAALASCALAANIFNLDFGRAMKVNPCCTSIANGGAKPEPQLLSFGDVDKTHFAGLGVFGHRTVPPTETRALREDPDRFGNSEHVAPYCGDGICSPELNERADNCVDCM